MNPCPFRLSEDISAEHKRIERERRFTNAAERSASSAAEMAGCLEAIRYEFAEYKAQNEAQREQDRLEQAKIDKKIGRRSWAQVVLALILAPLITLRIEHFDAVLEFIVSFLGLSH